MREGYTEAAPRTERLSGMRWIGFVLLAPAALCWLATLVLPTVRTAMMSLQNVRPLGDSTGQFVGLTNYGRLGQDGLFGQALGFTLAIVVVSLLAVGVVPPLLGLASGGLGARGRALLRLIFTWPLAFFTPVGGALLWSGLLRGNESTQTLLANPATARTTLLLVIGASSFAVACGIGLIAYGAAVRGPENRPRRKMVLAVWLVSLLAAAALALQSFTPSFALTGGGPARSTTTLALAEYVQGFQTFRFGAGAAIATILLAALAVLGICAGLVVIIGGVRLRLAAASNQEQRANRGSALAVLAAMILVGALGCGLAALPWAGGVASASRGFGKLGAVPISPLNLVNTVAPPFVSMLVQLGSAYLAALGIGALRPLGRASEWLLLPFSPWLFVSNLPLSLANFLSRSESGLLNTTVGLVSPILLSVPALFVLALFFKGQSADWRAGKSDFWGGVIMPSLPLAALLGAALLVVGLQDVFWPLLVSNSPDQQPLSVTLLTTLLAFGLDFAAAAAATLRFAVPLGVLFLLALGALQSFYVGRLALVDSDDAS